MASSEERDVGEGAQDGNFVFRDDFNNLSNWEVIRNNAAVSGGLLRLSPTEEESARIRHDLSSTVSEWEFKIRMALVGDGNLSHIYLAAFEDVVTAAWIELGYVIWSSGGESIESNFSLNYLGQDGNYYWFVHGLSDAVKEGSRNFMDVKVEMKNEILRFVVDDVILYNDTPPDDFPRSISTIFINSVEDGATLFDWIEVTGTIE